jgi:hypothetical protein
MMRLSAVYMTTTNKELNITRPMPIASFKFAIFSNNLPPGTSIGGFANTLPLSFVAAMAAQ